MASPDARGPAARMPGRFGSRLLPSLVLTGLLLGCAACGEDDALPDPSSEAYREAVTAFYTSLAAISTGEDLGAEEKLVRVTELAPGEPAAWANLAVLSLRRNELEEAAERLERAAALAPENAQIQMLLGQLASTQGRMEPSVAYLRRAVELDPRNVQALYALAQQIERTQEAGGAAEILQLLDRILAQQPDNLAVLLEKARIAARAEEASVLQRTLARLDTLSTAWPPEVRAQLATLQQAAAASDFQAVATQIAFLRNLLLNVPAYRASLAAVQTPATQVGELIEAFIRLPDPSPTPAPPDSALTFTPQPLPDFSAGTWTWTGLIPAGEEPQLLLAAADAERVRIGEALLPFPGGAASQPFPAHGIAPVDLDYDFRPDLAFAGPGGLRVFLQGEAGAYNEVTARLGLPPAVLRAAYTGVWAADVDLEGDMDLVLGTGSGPVVLRNNGDQTFERIEPFGAAAAPSGLRDFGWTDLDGDGDPDAVLLDDDGALRVFTNERLGQFTPRPLPAGTGEALAFTLADLDSDGRTEIVLLQRGGALLRIEQGPDGAWQAEEIAAWPALPAGAEAGPARLFAVELDNNGALDLVASTPAGSAVWISGRQHRLEQIQTLPTPVADVADLTGDGRLDLLGTSEASVPVLLVNQGTKNYHWQTFRPRAATAVGDQRINSFGIGGEIEIRTGLLFQQQPITSPFLHFGLGEHTGTDLARIIWPNGNVQAEFDLEADDVLMAIQRLKGSCPWLFTYDGEQMVFVTDFLWRSPLGLRINAQETAGVMTTEDWVKIRGDQLAPRGGYYDVRITAELWETHFFDHAALMVVDHPAETDIFVDERFAFPPPPLAVHTTTTPRPVAGAWDEQGRDVTALVQTQDARYLGTFERGPYQGIAREHYVEVELGGEAPTGGPLVLVASGWVRPTDSSINLAISQGTHTPPQSLSLEVPDGRGGWQVARSDLGFPAGKLKTILIDLEDVFLPGTPRRLRLRTNLEVYWDALAWAVPLPDTTIRQQRLAPETAELRFRGFSAVHEVDRSSPELPDYQVLAGTAQRWRDLIGFYTRFGDVRPLLDEVDDRYVIANAGDELALRFPAPPPPPEGWVRDFALIGDGWNKDGDYNTLFSKTVLPLPSHDRPDYSTPPGRLQDDPVYRRHPQDWQKYHTRYVDTQAFDEAMVPDRRAADGSTTALRP